MARKAFPVSWEEFHRDARRSRGACRRRPFSAIVCIPARARAGGIVSRELEIRMIETVCIAST